MVSGVVVKVRTYIHSPAILHFGIFLGCAPATPSYFGDIFRWSIE
jgi:hypothetical protein